ncbi:DMT family transporter [Bradyrhizobium amphicarpaeae]|uniref:EamA/RhaT family transporter n=1 Tax=Bradyrhizobium amphicarpaeae TaxID=1404768 RepID=A0A2U8PPI1_9BRAD|nr:DMT family transporter [Bradyrhizobium amphicarpaeae]AWL99669.1 EamA/RhaT family transporter [Bradyrhizobium amphicarpaeae]
MHEPRSRTTTRIAPAGLAFLAITSIGWGSNWPATKYLLGQLPPLTYRGVMGLVGAALLAMLAGLRGQSLRVPEGMWGRIILSATFNVTCWMVLIGFALLWLPASEVALIGYTMPVWAAIIAWPVLGEKPTALRTTALFMALAGLATIMGGNGISASWEKLPGIMLALGGAIGFAFGTVFAKKLPIQMPPLSSAAWQILIGCLPITLIGLAIETTDVFAITQLGWILIVYVTIMQYCVAYVSWFAALARLPASIASIGTIGVPVVGVLASAATLHEPLGAGQIAALLFTLASVVLATRS